MPSVRLFMLGQFLMLKNLKKSSPAGTERLWTGGAIATGTEVCQAVGHPDVLQTRDS
jgi:hypothetical protein